VRPSGVTVPSTENARAVLVRLGDSLAEAGLAGQIRVGRALSTAVNPLPDPQTLTPATQAAEEDVFSLDALLRPTERPARGRLIELCGEPSSGRTALAYRLIAGTTQRGELAGWVDLPNALDPRFLRRTGADLRALLWARPPHTRAALRAAELLLKAGFVLVVVDLDGAAPRELARLGTAAWARLLRAVRATRSTAVVLGPERVAGSHATLGVRTEKRRALFDRGLFEGLEGSGTIVRNRHGPTETEHALRVLHRPPAA
jgi:hypothetical protein